MSNSRLAVEVTKGDDFLNIWVDANNNGIRDDDDVNIFVTKSGGFFAESPSFKESLDNHIKQRLKEASVAFIEAGHDPVAEETICDLALELVVKACTLQQQEAAAAAPQPAAEPVVMQWNTQPAVQAEPSSPEHNEHGIPLYRPHA